MFYSFASHAHLAILTAATLFTASCAPIPASTAAAQGPASSPYLELEARRSSYGLSLRDPSDPDAKLARRFEQACQDRGGSFYVGMDSLPVSSALRAWHSQNPGRRLVLLSSGGFTRNLDETIVGRSEEGGSGPWTPVTVALQCQIGN